MEKMNIKKGEKQRERGVKEKVVRKEKYNKRRKTK